MVELYGRTLTRREVAAHAGALSQFAGVRLMTLGDGVERGIRMLEFRTGTGLRFTALVDRALDIADCEYKGMAIGWNSPAGFRHPGLHEYEGEGGLAWLRSFSGLLVTCGLDHILFMYDEPGRSLRLRPAQERQPFDPRPRRHHPRDASPAMASAGTATSAFSGPKASCSRRRCSARTCTSSAASRPKVGTQRDPAAPTASSITASTGRRTCIATTSMSAIRCWRRARAISRRSRMWSGPRMPATTTASRVSATAPCRRRSSNFHEQVWQHEMACRCRRRSAGGAGQRRARHRLRGGDAQGPVPLPVRMAEPAGRPICARHRALDQPRARPQGRRANAAS